MRSAFSSSGAMAGTAAGAGSRMSQAEQAQSLSGAASHPTLGSVGFSPLGAAFDINSMFSAGSGGSAGTSAIGTGITGLTDITTGIIGGAFGLKQQKYQAQIAESQRKGQEMMAKALQAQAKAQEASAMYGAQSAQAQAALIQAQQANIQAGLNPNSGQGLNLTTPLLILGGIAAIGGLFYFMSQRQGKARGTLG